LGKCAKDQRGESEDRGSARTLGRPRSNSQKEKGHKTGEGGEDAGTDTLRQIGKEKSALTSAGEKAESFFRKGEKEGTSQKTER